jgi:hypothetical protein
VVLTFAEIEDLAGFALPDLARLSNDWWTAPGPGTTRSRFADSARPMRRVRLLSAPPHECTLPVPHVRVVAGAPEEPGVYERIQQGVAHPRVQGPQILDLWSRQMQARSLGVLGADQL